jgi:hypothetical protein
MIVILAKFFIEVQNKLVRKHIQDKNGLQKFNYRSQFTQHRYKRKVPPGNWRALKK